MQNGVKQKFGYIKCHSRWHTYAVNFVFSNKSLLSKYSAVTEHRDNQNWLKVNNVAGNLITGNST